ncbi:MAG: thioredoxin family protein [Chromatiales bacterium]
MSRLFPHQLFFALFLLTGSVMLQAAQIRDPGQFFFHQSLGDLTEELEIAREEGKKGVLIMFEADDCPWCARMKKTVLNQAEVQDYFRKHFQILAIDIEGDVEITDFDGNPASMKDFSFKQHRVRATPVFAYFDLDGKTVKRARYTGAMTGVDEFMSFGRFIVDDIYKDMSFTRYKRSLKK